jgi:hypothetical protein
LGYLIHVARWQKPQAAQLNRSFKLDEGEVGEVEGLRRPAVFGLIVSLASCFDFEEIIFPSRVH